MTAVGQMQSGMNAFRSDIQQAVRASDDTLGNLHRALGELTVQARQIELVGRDVASLQDILQPPKLRGALGELMLARLLEQVLPKAAYSTQHRFADGRTVDAIVRVRDRLVPIDSKFPLEAFRRLHAAESDDQRRALRREFHAAIRAHVDAVARYILPDEGTLQFALMYVPAENVYYETIVNGEGLDGDLRGYAHQRRVIPVSPHTLYAYLEVVALGLKGLAIESRAQEVVDQLVTLNDALAGFREEFQVVGRHLSNAHARYSGAARKLDHFGFQLARAAEVSVDAPVTDGHEATPLDNHLGSHSSSWGPEMDDPRPEGPRA
jgi:DNA recombination protein RmuC